MITSPPYPTFAQFFEEAAVDLDYFDSVTAPAPPAGMGVSIVPRLGGANPNAVIDPAVGGAGLPLVRQKWWTGATGSTEILFWPYKVNGGSVMICAAGDGNGNPKFAESGSPATVSMLVYNYYFHASRWGTNKNRFSTAISDQDGYRQEFSDIPGLGGPHCEAWFEGPAGARWLGPKEQAIDAGDIVVIVQENYGMSIPAALQRTQEAVAFVKHEWAAGNIAGLADFDVLFDGVYLHGTSFGQGMAMVLGLLMPTTFDGSTE